MESLETAAGVRSSGEGQDGNVVSKTEITSEETQEVETKGWHQHPEEGRGRDSCDDSGKLEDPSSMHQDYEAYPLQPTKLFPIGRQKAAVSPGPATHRKCTSSPEVHQCSHAAMDPISEAKLEQKPQKPGKYVCDYCGRACAKPSVLKKHIRSHTGERPYPCVPCGFSFKTKSNLYKHRKSHAHAIKAGTLSDLASQGSFEGEGELFSDAEQSSDSDEDTLSDPLLLLDSPAEASDNTAVKVLNLISQKKGAQDAPQEINAPPAEASRVIQSSTIKQRLALRLSEKRSSDSENNLSLPSQSSKGSTDSGYFSRSESTEHQAGPPNTNAKSYQEIMFGKCYRPSPKQTAAFSEAADRRSERGVSRVFTQEKDAVESIRINTKSLLREETQELQSDADMATLIRSNSMPTSSAVCLNMPPALRGSHSFDERASTGGMRRLRRQAAFEHSAHESHADADSGKMIDSAASPSGLEMESYPSVASGTSHQRHAMELATRKRRKEKREEEDLSGHYEGRDECEEMIDSSKEYDVKQAAAGIMALGHLQMDISVSPEMSGRKNLGNVISVIQHTNSINRPHSEPSDSYKYHGQRQEGISFQAMESSESLERSDQSFQIPKLVRQPNIQVPEIRVTVEPDSPEKAPEVQVKLKEPEKEEFQWPQRSETLAQFPPEKLPPKKKRLRLADIEHSSGESSFESACTSLSRSPSQDSNLSYCSTFSFDREEVLKSPARQDEFGKPLELLAVPGSVHTLSLLNQRQQHEMRRSSSEQAPCNLRRELPEARSISFDYGSLTPTSKLKHVDSRERRRGNLVRQESLNMETEVGQVFHLSNALPIFSTGNTFPQLSHPSLSVPVRLQTHVPSFGSITYTSVSQIFDNQFESAASQTQVARVSRKALDVEALDLSSAKLKTGIPLSLTSRTISTTNASSGGTNKRMLSPASSLDLFMEVKQQKRVKEERMFGQIVEELSAVELGKCYLSEEKGRATPQVITRVESAMESSPPYVKEVGVEKRVELVAKLITNQEVVISEHSRLFPSLRTTTGVSWCFLNYTKPSCSPSDAPFSSVYASWGVSAHNPNPLDLNTSAALALLRSKQPGGGVIYSAAAMCPPGAGKLVSSLLMWRQTAEQLQRKPEPREADAAYGKKGKDIRVKSAKDEWKEREVQTLPTRVKIFEGGYKSNEEYVYVRGRGRGKYICEECGIRCKKPSMLKKHIRTHTDVRPYVCRVCNFAFKTKGNLTKHMKSKAHMKKCLELGVSVTMDDTEIQEHVDESKTAVATKHQFSDAEDSDGMDEDEIDEDEEEDEDYDGDSTPKLPSAAIHGYSESRERQTDDDSLTMLSPDQTSFLFDPYTSCLLSPGWESPIREPSPSRLRYPSPLRELSPRGRSSPRWDSSPLRPSSPSFSPIQRPLSPGEASARGRQRVVLRAVSPRRGSHQHKGEKSRAQAKLEMVQHQGVFEMETDQRSSLPPPQNLLSHLPLHSQQPVRSLLPLVPIGGRQMLPSASPPPPSSSPDAPLSSAPTPPSSEGIESAGEDVSQENPEQEVQTCLNAIASLKITTEDPH
ncbi:hypothetical protein PBY51_011212 [Eleginops maclovinus]|uniref:C2H2-type domain-containing protein n=1 Tax=Eleginops maclovinus TaxID=56733 RepID=A0AAN8ACU4_ELEMC|nr:hypothetical protein PBY51_011212 [Eleginops maclovinus]